MAVAADTSGTEPAEDAQPTCPVTLRIGTDVQYIATIADSIERHGRRYLDRVFNAAEIEACGGYDAEPRTLAPGLAGRFCAKEATLKALRPHNIIPEWRDIEIVRMPGGWVQVTLTGDARHLADECGLQELEVSLSHDGAVAVATVVGFATAPAAAEAAQIS